MRVRSVTPFWWSGVLALGWLLADRPAAASGQQVSPAPPPSAEAKGDVPPDPTPGWEVYDITRQLRNLARPSGAAGIGDDSGSPLNPAGTEPSDIARPPSAGGGSKASGGDPTTTGRPQEVGNPHLGQLPLKSFYDFENDGLRWVTPDGEYSLGIRAMSQLDAMVYTGAGPGAATSGFYNPRTRIYFEGNVT